MRLWTMLAWLSALGLIAFLTFETRRLAELVGRHEIAARTREAPGSALPAEKLAPPVEPPTNAAPAAVPAPVPAAVDLEPVAYSRQALELASTTAKLAAVTALLEQKNQEAAARGEAAAAEAARVSRAMPEGVRLCLIALHDCLRAEGFFGPRFLRAERVSPSGLEQVEMLDADTAGIDVAFVQAANMTATLDRATERLELRFFDGVRTVGAQRTALPKDGWELAFHGVNGPSIEASLPYLLRAEGAYQEPPAANQRAKTDVDPITRRQWIERFDHLLATTGSQPTWRVSRFRGMQDGWFLQAELIGTDEHNHVVAGAHCARLAVEVDATTATTSLMLRDGVLRRGGIESSIIGEGYRMLLPTVTPKQATDAMFGMVVSK